MTRNHSTGNHARSRLETWIGVALVAVASVFPFAALAESPVAVGFLVDKSKSMAEDGKLELANRGILETLDVLNENDELTVIGFDAAPFITVRMGPVGDKKIMRTRIERGMVAVGKSNLCPGFDLLERESKRSTNQVRHFFVVTDGQLGDISECAAKMGQRGREGATLSFLVVGTNALIPREAVRNSLVRIRNAEDVPAAVNAARKKKAQEKRP